RYLHSLPTRRLPISDLAEPIVEKLSIATCGSISKILAVFALSTAISANSCAPGLILIAQSANKYLSSPLTITKAPLVLLTPGFRSEEHTSELQSRVD